MKGRWGKLEGGNGGNWYVFGKDQRSNVSLSKSKFILFVILYNSTQQSSLCIIRIEVHYIQYYLYIYTFIHDPTQPIVFFSISFFFRIFNSFAVFIIFVLIIIKDSSHFLVFIIIIALVIILIFINIEDSFPFLVFIIIFSIFILLMLIFITTLPFLDLHHNFFCSYSSHLDNYQRSFFFLTKGCKF